MDFKLQSQDLRKSIAAALATGGTAPPGPLPARSTMLASAPSLHPWQSSRPPLPPSTMTTRTQELAALGQTQAAGNGTVNTQALGSTSLYSSKDYLDVLHALR